MAIASLSPVDYVICALMLAASASIGVYYACTGGKQRTTEEVFLGNRRMKVVPVLLSQVATICSAITILGTPAEVVLNGVGYGAFSFGICLAGVLSAFVIVPLFYKLQRTSILEYFEMRFSKGIRLATFLMVVLIKVSYSAIALYAPAMALNVVTGLSLWASIISVGAVCSFYITMGGIKAVVWADVLQVIIIMAGLVAILIKGSVDMGGFSNIWQIADNVNGSRLNFFDWNPNPTARHTIWSLTIGGTFTATTMFGFSQESIQRMQCLPTLRKAKIAMLLTGPGISLIVIASTLVGLVVFANYEFCDPITNKDVLSADQALPFYVMDKLSTLTGFPGLFAACVFSGALRQMLTCFLTADYKGMSRTAFCSSNIFAKTQEYVNLREILQCITKETVWNSLAALTLTEINTFRKKVIKGAQAALFAKILSFMYGLVGICFAFGAGHMGGVLQSALAVFGAVGGVIVGLLFLGILFPHCGTKSAYIASMAALALMLWIFIGSRIYPPPPQYHLPRSTDGCATRNGSHLNISRFNGLYFDDSQFNESSYIIVAQLNQIVTPLVATTNDSSLDKKRPVIAALYALSYQWYAMVAVFIVCLAGVLSSFVFGATPLRDVDARLISPFVVHLYCWLSREQKDLFRKKHEVVNSPAEDHEMMMVVHVTEDNVTHLLDVKEEGGLIFKGRTHSQGTQLS